MKLLKDSGRKIGKIFLTPIAKIMGKLGIGPTAITIFGFFVSIVCATVFGLGWIRLGGLLILVAGFFDMLDGAVARTNNQSSVFGAFIDSTIDRYTESFYLTGLMFFFMTVGTTMYPFIHHSYIVVTISAAIFGSLLVSYTKARAETLVGECNVGLFERPERMILLAVGSIIGVYGLLPSIVILAVLSNFTALQRIINTYKLAKKMEE